MGVHSANNDENTGGNANLQETVGGVEDSDGAHPVIPAALPLLAVPTESRDGGG